MSGPVPLTYTDIEAYCRLKGIYSLGERERLLRGLDALDREYMARAYEESKNSRPGKSPPPRQPGAPPHRSR